MLAPAAASAAIPTTTETFTTEAVTVQGYEVKQSYLVAPKPDFANDNKGYITKMEVDVVDPDSGVEVPISRLMLHHIVFANVSAPDPTCTSITGFDGSLNPAFSSERFYAAGEERAKMDLPEGYGYRYEESDFWGLLYMFMNHRSATDSAKIQYTITYVSDQDLADAGETIEKADPYWLDAENCKADPIYNVPGNGGPGSLHTRSYEFTMPDSGYLIGGLGHVHGGARELALVQPDCGDRQVSASRPTWGNPDHPFYNVRPILHEPGPINMSAFSSVPGVPITAGQRLRLDSVYDNSRPHTRVMGIMVVYFAEDDSVTQGCQPLPSISSVGTSAPGRTGDPIPYRIPLTGLNESGQAVTIKNPPGQKQRIESGAELLVGDNFFLDRNVKIRNNARLDWRFASTELHNVTLANGPIGIGSNNLNADRTFGYRFKKKGNYRFFCALHPVQMTQRVVVGKRRDKK